MRVIHHVLCPILTWTPNPFVLHNRHDPETKTYGNRSCDMIMESLSSTADNALYAPKTLIHIHATRVLSHCQIMRSIPLHPPLARTKKCGSAGMKSANKSSLTI